jgi:hypothetical protein
MGPEFILKVGGTGVSGDLGFGGTALPILENSLQSESVLLVLGLETRQVQRGDIFYRYGEVVFVLAPKSDRALASTHAELLVALHLPMEYFGKFLGFDEDFTKTMGSLKGLFLAGLLGSLGRSLEVGGLGGLVRIVRYGGNLFGHFQNAESGGGRRCLEKGCLIGDG